MKIMIKQRMLIMIMIQAMMDTTARKLRKNWVKPMMSMMSMMKAVNTQRKRKDTTLKVMAIVSLARFKLKILMAC